MKDDSETPREDPIEQGLALFQELVADEPELEREFALSHAEFAPEATPPAAGTASAEAVLAARRHLEWFLLEHPSNHLGGVPAEVLQDAWQALAARRGVPDAVAFLQSFCGVFEVTSCEPGRGLWATDLFGLGEYAIQEPSAELGIAAGDMLVGRLFALREGLHKLSPAACAYRAPRLLSAVRDDLARMRAGRRGVLRIAQIELERLFFAASGAFSGHSTMGAAEDADAPVPVDPEAERDRARAALTEAGLSSELSAEVVARVSAAAQGQLPDADDSIVVETLNEIAFSTDADLETSRRALGELWCVEVAGLGAPSPVPVPAETEEDSALDADEIRRALADFDRGRASGADLDRLFEDLASSLGVDEGGDSDPGEELPDFPGVVGAMVEEFLWDVSRERGEAAAEPLTVLRALSTYGQRIGVFENLSRANILDFAGRWLLDERQLREPSEVNGLVDALEAFAHWCEDRHALALAASCEDLFPKLRAELPRLVDARATCASDVPGTAPWDVLEVRDGSLDVRDVSGVSRTVSVPASLSARLRVGDLVHARLVGDVFEVTRCYPEVLRELVDGR